MRKTIIFLLLTSMVNATSAQQLTLLKNHGTNWDTSSVSLKNKPNGYMYRLRKDVQTDLPKVQNTESLELYIAEPAEGIGWLGFFRKPAGDMDYDFVVVLYDHDKKPLNSINLCDICDNHYCEVQDVRWDGVNRFLLFNMACPSYSDMIDGKGSKLYCYQVDDGLMVWETDYLMSNNIFIFNEKYVFCSYGFTHEKKRLFMLDKLTGKVYSKIPMVKDVDYMEIQEQNGKEVLQVVDNRNHLYTFRIDDTSTHQTPKIVKKPIKTPSRRTVNKSNRRR